MCSLPLIGTFAFPDDPRAGGRAGGLMTSCAIYGIGSALPDDCRFDGLLPLATLVRAGHLYFIS